MIRPNGPRVLVKELPEQDKTTTGGIVLPTIKEHNTSTRGEVLRTGGPLVLPNGEIDRYRETICIGDIIRYHKAVATKVPDGFIVDVINILGVE